VMGVCMWTIRPLMGLFKLLVRLLHTNPIQLIRASVATLLVAGVTAAVLIWTPWPAGRTAPGYVEYQDFSVLRADTAGFVREIHVQDGQHVSAGDLLVELENRELSTEVRDLELAIEQSSLKYHGHLRDKQTASAQIEAENRQALREQLAQKAKQHLGLSIRATISGRVLARQLIWKSGTFVKKGAEIVKIGTEARKEFRASLSQEDRDSLAAGGKDMRIRLRATDPFKASVRRVDPRASSQPLHEALTIVAGGDIAVRSSGSSETESKYELVEPRFTADFSLPKDVALATPVGTTGMITLRPRKYSSLGEGIYWSINYWLDEQLKAAFDS
jgi:putative peptide zinc metalloprotease protein